MRKLNRNLSRLNKTLRAIKWMLVIIALVMLVYLILSILVTFFPFILWPMPAPQAPSGQLAIF